MANGRDRLGSRELQPTALLIDPDALGGEGRGILFADARDIGGDDVNFMARVGKGLVAVAMPHARACALDLPPMPGGSMRKDGVITLANVEAVTCTGTGISAEERALTLRTLASLGATPADFVAPGHVIVTVHNDRVAPNGERSTLSDLALRHARSRGAVAIAWTDVLNHAGSVASAKECEVLALDLGLPVYIVGEKAVQPALVGAKAAAA